MSGLSRFLVFVLCLWQMTSVQAHELVIQGGFSSQSLGHAWEVFEDSTGLLSAEDVATMPGWRPAYVSEPNFGFSESVYWFRMRLRSDLLWDETFYLQVAYPLLGEVDVYWQQDNGHHQVWKTGFVRPYSSRPVAGRTFVFPIDIDARDGGDLLMRVRSQVSVQVPADLWTKPAFRAHEEVSSILLGVALGIPFVIMLYNLLLYVTVRDRHYLRFALHAFTMLLFLCAWHGLTAGYLWPEQPEGRMGQVAATALLATFFCNLFADRFLELQRVMPWVYLFNRGVRFLALAVLALLALLPASVANMMALALAGGSGIGITLAVLLSVGNGKRTTRIFGLAWMTLILGVTAVFFNQWGWAQLWQFSEFGLLLSVSIELLVTACALADRVNTERQLKISAQEAVIHSAARERAARARARVEASDAQRALNEAVLWQANMHQHLEAQVQERTSELEDANRRLLALYDEDPLTGLKNRRYFMERLEEEFMRAAQARIPLTLLLIDIDFFKRVNDQYGHLQGDQCVRHVAALLGNSVQRAGDCVARFGGEEFAILLPDVDAAAADTIAERIRARVEQTPAAGQEGNVRLTVSIGVRSFLPGSGETVDSWLQLTDKALYRAKAAGRNRVHRDSGRAVD